MMVAPALQKLLDELERLPGIGPKSAQRIAYWMLNTDKSMVVRLAEAIVEVKDSVRFCSRCFNYAEDDLCEICASDKRDRGAICVVADPRDMQRILPCVAQTPFRCPSSGCGTPSPRADGSGQSGQRTPSCPLFLLPTVNGFYGQPR